MEDDEKKDHGGVNPSDSGAEAKDDLKGNDELEKLRKQNEDFFKELKALKEKNKKFEDEKVKLAESKLREEGKLKELLELKENDLNKLSTKLKEKVLDKQIESAAIGAGLDPVHLKHFMSLAGSYKEKVNFDPETLEAEKESLQKFINEKKDEFKHTNFFAVEKKAPADGGVSTNKETKPKSLKHSLANYY